MMIKIAGLLLLTMVLLVPMASACYYPNCVDSSTPLTASSPNNTYTFNLYTASGPDGGIDSAAIKFTVSAETKIGTTSNYNDTISVTITDITDHSTSGIYGVVFEISGTPSNQSAAFATLASPPSNALGLAMQPSSKGGGGTASVTNATFTDNNAASNGYLTISNVYLVYDAWSNYDVQGADQVCAVAPEPTTMALMGLGLLAVSVVARKRRKS